MKQAITFASIFGANAILAFVLSSVITVERGVALNAALLYSLYRKRIFLHI